MNCCIKIYLREIPQHLPSHFFDSDGLVQFDLPIDLNFAETKVAEKLSSLGKISNDAVKGFGLNFTDKNNAIIAQYWSANQLDSAYFDILVNVFVGSRVIEQNTLIVKEKVDSDSTWEVELSNRATNWKAMLKDCLLCDLDYPAFTWNETSMQDNWANEAQYLTNTNTGYYFPLIDFGGWQGIDTMTNQVYAAVEDFRPQFHLLPMLQKAFCKIGYQFKCPVLETEIGRRIGAYLLGEIEKIKNKKVFGAKYCVQNDYQFVAQTSTVTHDFAELITLEQDYDYGGYFAPNQFQNISGEYCLKIQVMALFNSSPSPFPSLQVVVNHIRNAVIIDSDSTFMLDFITFDTKSFVLQAGDTLSVQLKVTAGSNLTILKSSFFGDSCVELIPKKPKITEGMSINPALLIDSEYTAFDLLEGFSHLINGRFGTDNVGGCVTLYSPYAQSALGEEVESFYKIRGGQIVLSDSATVVCDSAKFGISADGLKRYTLLGYAKPDDENVKDLGYSETNPFLGIKIDNGSSPNVEEDTENELNPFFEATEGKNVGAITNDFSSISLMAMLDNLDGEISTDIKPRLLIFRGLEQQTWYNTGTTAVPKQWVFEGNTMTDIPTAHYHFNNRSLAYYSAVRENWYGLAWRAEIEKRKLSLPVELLVLLDTCSYGFADFRDVYSVEYRGRMFTFLLSQIRDFRACERISTPVIFEDLKGIEC